MRSSEAKFALVFSRSAKKDADRLDAVTKRRIGQKLLKIAQSPDPLSYASRLVDPNIGDYRFRIGDYRVIFDLDGYEIKVLRIRHRREVYR